MDLITLIAGDRHDWAISELRESHEKTVGTTSERITALQKENHQLRIRVSLLIRLLIERGVFTAAEYSKVVQDTMEQMAAPKKPSRKKPKPL